MNQDKWISMLSSVEGIDAIVIGGSRSRGEADQKSDTDIGLYYNDHIDWKELENTLRVLMDDTPLSEKILYLPGEWGPWVNGGSGLRVDGKPYDVILRETKRVVSVIQEVLAGEITVDYQTGHPFGFVNAIYAAEVYYAILLWEEGSRPLTRLKENLTDFLPPKMKESLIERFMFEAEFSMQSGRQAAFRGDLHYIMGCFFRTVTCWNQVLYALNDRYFMNEKGSITTARNFPITPREYQVRVNQAYFYLAEHRPALGFQEFEMLHEEIIHLVEKHRLRRKEEKND